MLLSQNAAARPVPLTHMLLLNCCISHIHLSSWIRSLFDAILSPPNHKQYSFYFRIHSNSNFKQIQTPSHSNTHRKLHIFCVSRRSHTSSAAHSFSLFALSTITLILPTLTFSASSHQNSPHTPLLPCPAQREVEQSIITTLLARVIRNKT